MRRALTTCHARRSGCQWHGSRPVVPTVPAAATPAESPLRLQGRCDQAHRQLVAPSLSLWTYRWLPRGTTVEVVDHVVHDGGQRDRDESAEDPAQDRAGGHRHQDAQRVDVDGLAPVSNTHLRAHETDSYLVCRLL